MRSAARVVHLLLSILLVAGLVAQIFLAGLAVFDTPRIFGTHRDWGYTLSIVPVLLVVAGLVGRMGQRIAIQAVVIFLLFILQSVFVVVRTTSPAIAALHPVNGFLILLLAIVILRDSWSARRLAAA